jgi:hypothetical protein
MDHCGGKYPLRGWVFSVGGWVGGAGGGYDYKRKFAKISYENEGRLV